ncbi:MAG: hypothetical protein ACM336_09110 [Acidobacteriota bacterium]
MDDRWKPLVSRLGAARCVGFMYMGQANRIYHYKHGLTRRYLLLDADGRVYEAAGRNEFREIAFEEAVARVPESH